MKVKSPPLLNVPPSERKPWIEVDQKRVDNVLKELYVNVTENVVFKHVRNVSSVVTLGYEKRERAESWEGVIRKYLREYGREGEIVKFLHLAEGMSRLDFDIRGEIEGASERVGRFFDNRGRSSGDAWTAIYLGQAKKAGFDVSKWIDGKTMNLGIRSVDLLELVRKQGDGVLVKLILADELKNLNIDVSQELEKDKSKLVKPMEIKTDGEYVEYLARLKRLGLLDTQDKRQTPPMPPLKEVRG